MPGKFLAEFELYVMMAIARLDADAYGASVRREIEERTGRPVSIGALYATLARLGDKGYLDFDEVDPEPGQRGRSRKYCRLTPAGRAAMDHSVTMMQRMMEGLAPAGPGEGER
ncbi:MAG: helix-turn-helix transcriptional regulator [Acidobacteriota bacterium]|jgi:DNA-binding PadR family transcriptional regulator